MISLIKIDNIISDYLTDSKCKNIILISKENTVIGSIKLNNDSNNIVDIYIKEEHRGNGYGKQAFKDAVEICKKENKEELLLSFNNDNYLAKRLVASVKGVHLATNNNIVKYVIPKN